MQHGWSGVTRLLYQCRRASGAGQLDNLAVDEGSAGHGRLFAAATPNLAHPRMVPAGTMPKHVSEGMTCGVANGMSRETSPAGAATKVPTRVLRMERSASEERDGNDS
jgi:hypothetical protein